MAHDDPYAGKSVDADWAYDLSRATSYTPALTAVTTNPNLGADGTIEGWYHRNGHLITGGVRILFSGTGVAAGSGFYEISLPFAGDTSLVLGSTTIGAGFALGAVTLRDDSTSTFRSGTAFLRSAASGLLRILAEGGGTVADNAPWTWATADRISLNFMYPADPSVL